MAATPKSAPRRAPLHALINAVGAIGVDTKNTSMSAKESARRESALNRVGLLRNNIISILTSTDYPDFKLAESYLKLWKEENNSNPQYNDNEDSELDAFAPSKGRGTSKKFSEDARKWSLRTSDPLNVVLANFRGIQELYSDAPEVVAEIKKVAERELVARLGAMNESLSVLWSSVEARRLKTAASNQGTISDEDAKLLEKKLEKALESDGANVARREADLKNSTTEDDTDYYERELEAAESKLSGTQQAQELVLALKTVKETTVLSKKRKTKVPRVDQSLTQESTINSSTMSDFKEEEE